MSLVCQLEAPEAADLPVDDLFRLQLRIARRADELARLCERDVACDYWQTAERELLPDALRLSA